MGSTVERIIKSSENTTTVRKEGTKSDRTVVSKTTSIVQREENQGKRISMDKENCRWKIWHQEAGVLTVTESSCQAVHSEKKNSVYPREETTEGSIPLVRFPPPLAIYLFSISKVNNN